MKKKYLLSSRANPLSLRWCQQIVSVSVVVVSTTSYSLVIYYKYFSIYIDWAPNSYTLLERLFITPPKLAYYRIRL
ncbi:hypothetical protein I312_104467 [Cryptococcus bacillisporus CA1280]|uniref:uncharacterized protein n=1 Tax=Cryptococcus bacillisporus CA1280 TaxID=1296109 RepID=UPI003366ABDC